jgi:hypothetical protein
LVLTKGFSFSVQLLSVLVPVSLKVMLDGARFFFAGFIM